MSDEPWEHLKAYGYAPGRYTNRCRWCNQMFDNLDKRAITCRSCAEKRHVEAQAQQSTTDELPPMYSADQLRAYGDARAAEAVKAERKRCAQVCGKSEAWWDWEDYAASIRALGDK